MTDPRSRRSLTFVLPDEIDGFYPERILAQGPYGTVYEGTLKEGGRISVVRFDQESPFLPTGIIEEEHLKYLTAHGNENIVKLFHICKKQQKKLVQQSGRHFLLDMWQYYLLLEYTPKGTLENYITADATIGWDTRFKIIKGICQGLHSLHTRMDGPVIHATLGPDFIWLDDNWVPKIFDMGLSRILGNEQTRIMTIHVMGKNGYMAPEYLYRGEISTKSDIYSLGVLIIVITTGEKNTGNAEDRAGRQFIDKVRRYWYSEDKIICKYPSLSADGHQQVKACLNIGLKCLEADRNRRPSIEDIVKKLDGEPEVAPIFDQESVTQDDGAGEGRHRATKVTRALLQISASIKRGRPEEKPMSSIQ